MRTRGVRGTLAPERARQPVRCGHAVRDVRFDLLLRELAESVVRQAVEVGDAFTRA
jgi:hypothetical protein